MWVGACSSVCVCVLCGDVFQPSDYVETAFPLSSPCIVNHTPLPHTSPHWVEKWSSVSPTGRDPCCHTQELSLSTQAGAVTSRQHLTGRTWSAVNHIHLPQAVLSCRRRLRDLFANRHPMTVYRSQTAGMHPCVCVLLYMYKPILRSSHSTYILCVYCAKFILYNSILYNHDCPSQSHSSRCCLIMHGMSSSSL